MRLSPPHLALALAALLAFPAAAAEPQEPAALKKPAAEAGPAMKIHVDPATGALRPEAAPGAKGALAAAPAESLPPLKVQKVQASYESQQERIFRHIMITIVTISLTKSSCHQKLDTINGNHVSHHFR